MNKNAFKLIIGSLLIAAAIHWIKPASRSQILPMPTEQETVPVRAPAPEADKAPTPSAAVMVPSATVADEAPQAKPTSIPDVILKVQQSLPRIGQITFKNNEEVHHVHPAILQAGLQLGRLKEIWMQKPEARKAALEFYEQCTFDVQVVDSVRALCYINAVEVSVYLKKTERVMTWTLDHSVQNLASRLMGQ